MSCRAMPPRERPCPFNLHKHFTLRISNVHSSCWLQNMGEKLDALCVLGHSLLHKIVTWIVQGQRAPFLPSNKIFELNKISTLKSALSPLFTMNWAGLNLDLVGLSLVGSLIVQLCTPGWGELLGTGSRRNSHKKTTRILSVDFQPLFLLISLVAWVQFFWIPVTSFASACSPSCFPWFETHCAHCALRGHLLLIKHGSPLLLLGQFVPRNMANGSALTHHVIKM